MINGGSIGARRWQDGVNLILGVWLFISPWVFGLTNMSHNMALTFWVLGAIVFVSSAITLFVGGAWGRWLNLCAGVLMAIAAFSGAMIQSVMWNALIVGVVVFIVAAWGLAQQRTAPIGRM